jgi:hypothetical protein
LANGDEKPSGIVVPADDESGSLYMCGVSATQIFPEETDSTGYIFLFKDKIQFNRYIHDMPYFKKPSVYVHPTLMSAVTGIKKIDGMTSLVAEDHIWDKGKKLRVFFMDTPATGIVRRTLTIANRWFDGEEIFVPAASRTASDIRVSFAPGHGYWSKIGKITGQDNYNTTMWLSSLHRQNDSNFIRVVLHEFGHALGLLHEHQHPLRTIQWDKPKVYRYFGSKPYNWTNAETDLYVLRDANYAIASDLMLGSYEEKSIMMYHIPDSLTLNGDGAPMTWTLTKQDKATVRKLYKTY